MAQWLQVHRDTLEKPEMLRIAQQGEKDNHRLRLGVVRHVLGVSCSSSRVLPYSSAPAPAADHLPHFACWKSLLAGKRAGVARLEACRAGMGSLESPQRNESRREEPLSLESGSSLTYDGCLRIVKRIRPRGGS